jgi:F-type H+-transporting ATPase subunit epsilon
MADPMEVRVVSADRLVWSGEAENVIAKTVEGDLGVLPGHEPVMALLAPAGVEVFLPDGTREVVAVDGGFVSVEHNRVSVISEYARMAQEVTAEQAERDLAAAQRLLDEGDESEEVWTAYSRAAAQVHAAHKVR